MLALYARTVSGIGSVVMAATKRGVCLLSLGDEARARAYLATRYPGEPIEADPAPTDEAARQLEAYAAGRLTRFTFPIDPRGTPFQQQVWEAVAAIPYGATRSYGQIAAQIGRPTAVRAVGAANGANPLCIVVPCHRVIGANGKPVGYAYGLEMKQRLLQLEAKQGSAG
jgi:O-6-methylguanine DNA methyltransferase